MSILALDLSKRSTGWSILPEGADKPIFGTAVLGSEFTCDGQTFGKLHQILSDLRKICQFEHIFYEQAIHPASLTGHTNIDTLRVLSGLCAHVESFGYAVGCRTVTAVNVASWRRHFVGRMPRATKSKQWKDYCIERCQQYGWSPRNSDEADSLGLLDYGCEIRGFTPPWRVGEILRPLLAGTAR